MSERVRARRVALQHLEAMRLDGVDAAPLRRRAGAAPAPAPMAASAPQAARPGASVVSTAQIEPKPVPVAQPPAAVVVPGPDRSAAQARLDEVRRRYEADAPHRHFVTAFTNIVFGEGDPCARLMFVGEAPGEEEDRTGRPFVGRAGQLLDKMIAAMGLKRSDVYIANVLKTRPPNNATPTPEEAALCAPYLFDQIRAVGPEVIVTLGLPATRLILGVDESMSRLRGRWAAFEVGGPAVPVMPTYHPAYVLRQYTAEVRGKVWSDLRLVMDRLGLAGGAPEPGGPGSAG